MVMRIPFLFKSNRFLSKNYYSLAYRRFRRGFAEVFLKKVAKNFKYVYTRQVLRINEH